VCIVNVVDRTLERFQITDNVVDLIKLVTVFCVVHRACQIFQIDQIFSNDAELVFPVDVIDRVRKILQLMDDLLDAVKVVVSFLNAPNRPRKIFQSLHLLLQLIELMACLNILSHWICHLFQSVNLLGNLFEVVLPINLVHGVVEGFEIRQILINFCKVVSPLN